MNYNINYNVQCQMGRVRSNNQDNFWCLGQYLESENIGLSSPVSGVIAAKERPLFAVFDGMGGEQRGEQAAFLAAQALQQFNEVTDKTIDELSYLTSACREMNLKICDYAVQNHIAHMGTTAAIILFGAKEVYICNIGDSRIYQCSDNQLTKISVDHCEKSIFEHKPPLTQHLGIPEQDFIIQPYVAKGQYEKGDRYLICSDGLTDMVTDKQILDIMSAQKSLADCAAVLMAAAINNGGIDNITIILCELIKQNNRLTLAGFRKNNLLSMTKGSEKL